MPTDPEAIARTIYTALYPGALCTWGELGETQPDRVACLRAARALAACFAQGDPRAFWRCQACGLWLAEDEVRDHRERGSPAHWPIEPTVPGR